MHRDAIAMVNAHGPQENGMCVHMKMNVVKWNGMKRGQCKNNKDKEVEEEKKGRMCGWLEELEKDDFLEEDFPQCSQFFCKLGQLL